MVYKHDIVKQQIKYKIFLEKIGVLAIYETVSEKIQQANYIKISSTVLLAWSLSLFL